VIAAGSAWVYVAHTLTTEHPFFDTALFRNRNLITGCLFSFFTGSVMFASTALTPMIMQNLMGYPPILAGLMNLPRGVGMLVSVIIAGRLANRMDLRLLLLLSIATGAVGVWMMTKFDLMMDSRLLQMSGFLQGFGTGMFFVPITALAFLTVGPEIRAEASSLFNMIRNIGSSIGIALLQAQAVANTRTMHAAIAGRVNPEDQVLSAALPSAFDPATLAGRVMLDAEITRQAMMTAYVNDFRVLLIACFLVMPLILLLQVPKNSAPGGPAPVVVD
jgi:DHA2 family multidrug resistance protein